MTIVPDWVLRLAGHDRPRERRLAEASQVASRAELQRDLQADERRFRERMGELERVPHVVIGTSSTGVPYRMAVDEIASLPGWATAGTGTGKSRFAGGLMARVMAAIVEGAPIALVLLDGKGELGDQQLRTIAAIAGHLPPRARVAFLSRVHTLRFFDRQFLPSFPLLAPMPGVSIVTQADLFAETLTDVSADATTGPRQRSSLAAFAALAVEKKIEAAAWPWMLSSARNVAAMAAESSLPSVRLALARFEREPQGSIDGLIARLDALLRVPSLKAILSGPRSFDFSACFEPGAVTTIDFGGADLGARAGVRAMGSLAVSALANAAFDPRRTVRSTTLIVVDEPQTIMTAVTLGQFERLVTLGRSFGAGGLLLLHQGATQLPPELQNILNTNVAWRVIGRSSERDAAASSEWLPRTGRVPRPREPGSRGREGAFLSEGEEQRFRIAELGRLPPRHFLVADRRAPFAARVIRAPDHDPPAWSAMDPGVADAVKRGTSGVPRAELEVRVRQIEEEAAARFVAQAGADEVTGRRRAGAAPAPDVVGRTRGRGRQGDVP